MARHGVAQRGWSGHGVARQGKAPDRSGIFSKKKFSNLEKIPNATIWNKWSTRVSNKGDDNMMQIGRYKVYQQGGNWHVYDPAVQKEISKHDAKWSAIKRARLESWHVHTHRKPPAKADTEAGGE